MEKQKIGVKMNVSYKEAVAYLKALVESLESGKIVVKNGEEHVTLTPQEQVAIEVEAKTKKDKQKFSLEISWTEQAAADLKISDKEPEPVALAAPEKKAELPQAEKREALPDASPQPEPQKEEKKAKEAKKEKKTNPAKSKMKKARK
ncbi:amphi-Trp domain-containing protein [Pseudodesulfovibrio sp.]|uniref:amphi-Trp domain-containing protein n=1 Tax=unclassified Pseudodesulfovibrio TaxID=2661612 RepID=UPI003B006B09